MLVSHVTAQNRFAVHDAILVANDRLTYRRPLSEIRRRCHCSLAHPYMYVCSTLVPVATHHRWCWPGGVRVVPHHPQDSVTALTEAYETLSYIREADTTAGVLFRTFCRQNMCMESWNFAVEAVAYEVRVIRQRMLHALNECDTLIINNVARWQCVQRGWRRYGQKRAGRKPAQERKGSGL